MSVLVRPGHLRLEMARRGLDAAELARESRLSQATINAALSGRPIAAKTLALLAQALIRVPIIDGVDSLLFIHDEEIDL